MALHLQKHFQTQGYRQGDFPHSEEAAREVLTLPIYPELEEGSLAEVGGAVGAFYTDRTMAPAQYQQAACADQRSSYAPMERHDRERRPIGLDLRNLKVREKNSRRDKRFTTSNLLHKIERTICEFSLATGTDKPGLAVGTL